MFLLIMSSSCSEDWLKPDPLSFYAPENVFIDQSGFESALIRCKKEMLADHHGSRSPVSTEFAYSDLALPLWNLDFRKNTPSSVFAYTNMLNVFINAYGYIKNANTVISRINTITWPDETVKNRILSEAFWFRAYWYYRLVNTYGDVPWVGDELKGAKLDYYSTKRWTILARIQADLEFAAANLPVTAKLGDVTKGAANHLLTKVYLANAEFDKAIASATEVINGPYALMTQRFGIDVGKGYHDLMWDLHRVENKSLSSNTEFIYNSVERSTAAKETWWETSGLSTYSMRNYCPAYWRNLDATGARATNWDTPPGDTLGIGNADCRTTQFFNRWIWNEGGYTWQNTPDMRKAPNNWVEMGDVYAEIITYRIGSPQKGLPLSKLLIGNLRDTCENWYSWPIYKTYVDTPHNAQPHGGQGDWYVFRLAETYLLRAEAYIWKNQHDLAAIDINVVRARANAPLITAGDVDIEYLFDERARELYTEEPRHSEMVRVSMIMAKQNLNGYSEATIHQKNWYHDRVMRVNYNYSNPKMEYAGNTAWIDPHNMWWPIPQSVITANTLGRINQNVGYDGADLNVPPLETIPE